VLFVDAIFTAIEDAARHKADARMNARETRKFEYATKHPGQAMNQEGHHDEVHHADAGGAFVTCTWRDIQVGDIIQVNKYEAVPADIVLLAVHEPDIHRPVGLCFIETKSLDGETNLKTREALPCTFAQVCQDPGHALAKLPGRILCEVPNHDVNTFFGRYEPDMSSVMPIDAKNVILRSCVVRNTPYVIGVVVNTGPCSWSSWSSSFYFHLVLWVSVENIETIVSRSMNQWGKSSETYGPVETWLYV
jgi:magnesium-transporting ATPase (P-type)